ncbi:MAG TPA: PAS domain S-box protein, partial [Candidatus Synoicihabitans sp.]|nr:PAS domain S-box protein [Candidatus Synoicihabitans sp.]
PEREFSTPGNSARYWLTRTYAPLRAGNGEIIGVIINLNDVTERRNTTLTLQESRARFESIIASAMDAIITVDAEQKIMLFNSAAERLFRCEAEQAVGTSLERFLPESVRTAHREHLRAFGRTGASSRAMGRLGVLHGVRANGEHFPIEASISHATLGGQKWFTVILRDVSERVAAEAALKESEARFRQLAENIDAVFWMREVAEDRLLYISPAYERVWGRRCSELLQSPESWLDAVHPDDRDRIQHAAAMMVERGSYEGVYRILRPDGTIRWIQDRGYPIRDDTGNIHRFAGTAPTSRRIGSSKSNSGKLRRWRPSARSRAASRTTSTIFSPPSTATPSSRAWSCHRSRTRFVNTSTPSHKQVDARLIWCGKFSPSAGDRKCRTS